MTEENHCYENAVAERVNAIMSNSKTSIRFFDDREVRAIWDEEQSHSGRGLVQHTV